MSYLFYNWIALEKCLALQIKEISVDVSEKIELQNHIILSIDVITEKEKVVLCVCNSSLDRCESISIIPSTLSSTAVFL